MSNLCAEQILGSLAESETCWFYVFLHNHPAIDDCAYGINHDKYFLNSMAIVKKKNLYGWLPFLRALSILRIL